MKTLILTSLLAAAVYSVSACTTVETTPTPPVRTSTTTTDRTAVQYPSGGTTETKTTRTY